MSDPIADFLNRLKNASRARRTMVTVPSSQLKRAIAEVLEKHQFISGYEEKKEKSYPELIVTLKEHNPLEMKRISKPGQRIYIKAKELKPVLRGFGIAILSTSQGVMTQSEAKKKNLGGELLCTVS